MRVIERHVALRVGGPLKLLVRRTGIKSRSGDGDPCSRSSWVGKGFISPGPGEGTNRPGLLLWTTPADDPASKPVVIYARVSSKERAAASALSSGRVLKAMTAPGAALCTALIMA